ncbi:hypothetical protein KSP40_PGU014032 [Platanthera guangdongensis]|uniref:Zinc finger LSD1-type domain-containing protein n=1 Tax=Platanthera guangdongensis TaxID=2320717 RepID=A0ABR2LDB4_9ASPA
MTMCSSPDSTSPEWEENIIGSPETLPPGFECACPLPTTNSPPENPPSSLPPPPSPSPQDKQVNPTHRPPSPTSSPPQNIQIHHPPLENSSSLPDPIPPSPSQERTISSNSPFPPPQQENLDPVSQSALQPLENQAPLQLPQENLGSPHPSPPQSLPEMGQMVCGNCSELLSYPRGSKYVQCGCCQTTNYVLEAYQVGIVNCAKCFLLLMYPYAAKSLRCSSCHFVTEIGPSNLRPPVSVLQGFPAPSQNGLSDLQC